MDSIKDEILIQKYLDKSLSASEREEFNIRLKEDGEFAEKVKSISELAISLRASSRIIKEKESKTLVIKRLMWAASIIIILGLASTLFIFNDNKKNIITEKTVFREKEKLLSSENFRPNPVLENNLQMSYRSTVQNPAVVSPVDSFVLTNNEKLIFEIQGISNPYYIFIYNNELEKVYESEKITENRFMPQIQLTEGLYYWKIEQNNEVYWPGRFFIIP